MSLFDVTETVQHAAFQAGATDAYGNPVDAWATPVGVDILAFDPGTTDEPFLSGHDRVVTSPTLYLPPGVVFNPRDQVTARGVLYEVDGVTRQWSHLLLEPAGGVVTLRRVEG